VISEDFKVNGKYEKIEKFPIDGVKSQLEEKFKNNKN
jgi:hypothetical protein